MKQNFIELLEFNDWANAEIIRALIKMESPDEKPVGLINHIIAAQDLWLERIKNELNYAIDLWEMNGLHDCYVLSRQSSHNWIKLVKNSTEKKLKEERHFQQLFQGTPGFTINQIINHVISHSNYHRGQINTLIRSSGNDSVNVDYFDYLSN